MKVIAFDIRTAGPRVYEHAILDVGAVVVQDGEVVDQFHAYLGINDYLSYRPSLLRDCEVSMKGLRSGSPYHDGVGDFCAWLDEARGSLPVWAFEAREKAGFVANSLKYSKAPYELERLADVGSLYGVMMAVGAVAPGRISMEHILHRLEIELPQPRVDAVERAKLVATAAAMLEGELRDFYLRPDCAEERLLFSLPAGASDEFDPFAEEESPLAIEGNDPDRHRKAVFATLGEKGIRYEGAEEKKAVRAFLSQSRFAPPDGYKSATELTPEVWADRRQVIEAWARGEIEIPSLDTYLAQQGSLL